MLLLDGQIALVTGASRGFGYAAAYAFARAGAHVVAVARTMGGLEDLDDDIKGAGGTATLVPLDITDDAGLARLGAALYERFGGLDLWLHTAAFAPFLSPLAHVTDKDLDKALATDLRAFQRLVRVVDPLLRLARGSRALVATEDRTDQAFWGFYAGVKAAQSAMTRAWALEARADIAVAEVVPPAMPTALRSRFYPTQDHDALVSCDEAAKRLIRALEAGVSPGARIVL